MKNKTASLSYAHIERIANNMSEVIYKRCNDLVDKGVISQVYLTDALNDLSLNFPSNNVITSSFAHIITKMSARVDIFFSERELFELFYSFSAPTFDIDFPPYESVYYCRRIGVDIFDYVIDELNGDRGKFLDRLIELNKMPEINILMDEIEGVDYCENSTPDDVKDKLVQACVHYFSVPIMQALDIACIDYTEYSAKYPDIVYNNIASSFSEDLGSALNSLSEEELRC